LVVFQLNNMNPNNSETKFYQVDSGAETFSIITGLPDENCLPPGTLLFDNEEKAWEVLEIGAEIDWKIANQNANRLREELRFATWANWCKLC